MSLLPGYRDLLALCLLTLIHPTPARADAVLDWNILALKTTAAAPFNPPLETRNIAIVHAAIFDAVNAILHEFERYSVKHDAPSGASAEAAAVAAAHLVLVHLYPEQQASLDAAYSASLVLIADGPAKSSGLVVGEAVASRMLMLRASDGAAAAINVIHKPGDGPGSWIPTPPAYRSALDPGWGSVRPFCLKEGLQFRPGPPPALDSARYARDFNEIKEVGSSTSSSRTQEQTDLARFWVATASQIWNPAARQMAVAKGLSLSQNARVFALLNLAGADAFIAAWDAKFTYTQWRPVTAIRAADTAGNLNTVVDPAWTPLLVTPPFPDYIAGHTTYAGAAQEVLDHVFGENPSMVLMLTSDTAPGVVKRYKNAREIADGVVDARVWGGIHWRTSDERGRAVGENVGRYTVRHFLKPKRGNHWNRNCRPLVN